MIEVVVSRGFCQRCGWCERSYQHLFWCAYDLDDAFPGVSLALKCGVDADFAQERRYPADAP